MLHVVVRRKQSQMADRESKSPENSSSAPSANQLGETVLQGPQREQQFATLEGRKEYFDAFEGHHFTSRGILYSAVRAFLELITLWQCAYLRAPAGRDAPTLYKILNDERAPLRRELLVKWKINTYQASEIPEDLLEAEWLRTRAEVKLVLDGDQAAEATFQFYMQLDEQHYQLARYRVSVEGWRGDP